MTRVDLSEFPCSIARTLDVVGDKWTLLVLRDCFYGLRRFDEFRSDLGIARNVLTDRLNRLVEQGVLVRVPYQDNPPRDEYRLTDKGRDLLPVILAMFRWGDRWAWREDDPEIALVHASCGEATHADPACAACGEQLHLRDLRLEGLPSHVREAVASRRTPVASAPDA